MHLFQLQSTPLTSINSPVLNISKSQLCPLESSYETQCLSATFKTFDS
jgi:hypothetical protein